MDEKRMTQFEDVIYQIQENRLKTLKSVDAIVDIFTDYVYDGDETGYTALKCIHDMYEEIMKIKAEQNLVDRNTFELKKILLNEKITSKI